MPLFMGAVAIFKRATRLTLDVRETKLVYYGGGDTSAVAAALEKHTGGERMVVSGSGTYAGVPIGPQARDRYWGRVVAKARNATGRMAGRGPTLSDRTRVYRMFGQSIAWYLLQFGSPGSASIRADRAARAMASSAPAHAMGPGLMPDLPAAVCACRGLPHSGG